MQRFGSGKVALVVGTVVLICLCVIAWAVYGAISTPTAVHTRYPTRGVPTKGVATLRSAVVLTDSYVATTDTAELRGYSLLRIFFDITKGSLTSFEYKVWSSHDGVNWFQEANETVGVGVITDRTHYYQMFLSDDVKFFKDVAAYGQYVKLEVKGTGTVTGSLCAVYVMGVE